MNTIRIISIFVAFVLITKEVTCQIQLSNFTYNNLSASTPAGYLEFGGELIFRATTDDFGAEIWISDGTAINTRILKDINPGFENSEPFLERSAILENELYFIAADNTSDGEIWKTDGTEAGTEKLTSFINGETSNLTTVNDKVFFLVRTEPTLMQLWKTDGTETGTTIIKDSLAIVWNDPTFTGKCNDTFIFTFQPSGTNNSIVWRSDGTAEGTYPITEEIGGNGSGPGGSSSLTQYIEYNDHLFFVSENHLIKTDGTLENTINVAEMWQADFVLVEYSDVIELNNKLYFSFYSHVNNQLSIWESDGTTDNTFEIYSINNNEYFFPSNFSSIGSSLIFCSTNQANGTSLISLDINTYDTAEICELEETSEEPFIFLSILDACQVSKINENELFISSPLTIENNYERHGWIIDLSTNTTNQVPDLDDVFFSYIFEETIYYSKDNQFWKYANLPNSTTEVENLKLILYPNPTSDYIFFNMERSPDQIKVFDLMGRLLILNSEENKESMDISFLENGAYIIQMQIDEKIYSEFLLKN